MRNPAIQSDMPDSLQLIAAGPSWMNRIQRRSVSVTCLMMPPTDSSLAVLRCAACSSVRSRAVNRRKWRCFASAASRSARSPVTTGALVSDMVALPSGPS